MQALRLARPSARLSSVCPRRGALQSRALTATASSVHAAAPSSATAASAQSVIPLSNVEAQWENLSQDEQLAVHQQLEEIQKKDWKTLSIDEKKAGQSLAPRFSFVYTHAHTYTSLRETTSSRVNMLTCFFLLC